MMIKLLLVAFFACLAGYALSQRSRSNALALLMFVISLLGVVFVLLPNMTNVIANTLDVGRGTDLVLYLFITFSLSAVLNLHLRVKGNSRTTTLIARAVAIQSARAPATATGPGGINRGQTA